MQANQYLNEFIYKLILDQYPWFMILWNMIRLNENKIIVRVTDNGVGFEKENYTNVRGLVVFGY